MLNISVLFKVYEFPDCIAYGYCFTLLNLGLDVFAITSCVGMHIFMNASLL